MKEMSATEFEQRYRADPDPWNYRCSPYEQRKYAATLAACGAGPFEHALELGGSIGLFSAQLAERCRRLTTIDFSPTAVRLASARLAEHPDAIALLGEIPAAIPAGRYDLVVASEILYYLDEEALTETLHALDLKLARGGRIVCVHWRPAGTDRPLDAEFVHAKLRSQDWLVPVLSQPTDEYLLDVLERQ
jgi:cyclopropane fatty-acyl-phospholipid synthase-like methyltransferase